MSVSYTVKWISFGLNCVLFLGLVGKLNLLSPLFSPVLSLVTLMLVISFGLKCVLYLGFVGKLKI